MALPPEVKAKVLAVLDEYLDSSLDKNYPPDTDLDAWKRRAGEMQAAWEGCHKHREELLVKVAELEEKLQETEHDMHMRIRAGYDKTVADSWRAILRQVHEQATRRLRATSEKRFLQTDLEIIEGIAALALGIK